MKLETFEKLITSCIEQLEKDNKRNAALAEAFGGDTYIYTINDLVDYVSDALAIEYPDFEDSIDYAIFGGDEQDLHKSIKELWLYVEGKSE